MPSTNLTPRHQHTALALFTLNIVLASATFAQPASDRLIRSNDLQRVEAGRADTGALDASSRVLPKDLKVPNDFAGVFRVPQDADSPYAGWYARVQSGIIAVFPQSTYVAGRATIPPNTKFFLGGIPMNPQTGRPAGELGVNTNIDTRLSMRDQSQPTTSKSKSLFPPSQNLHQPQSPPARVETLPRSAQASEQSMQKLFEDPIYRAQRLSTLITRAAR